MTNPFENQAAENDVDLDKVVEEEAFKLKEFAEHEDIEDSDAGLDTFIKKVEEEALLLEEFSEREGRKHTQSSSRLKRALVALCVGVGLMFAPKEAHGEEGEIAPTKARGEETEVIENAEDIRPRLDEIYKQLRAQQEATKNSTESASAYPVEYLSEYAKDLLDKWGCYVKDDILYVDNKPEGDIDENTERVEIDYDGNDEGGRESVIIRIVNRAQEKVAGEENNTPTEQLLTITDGKLVSTIEK